MATNPKIKPCPYCGSADHIDVYKYDSGWCYVECDNSACTSKHFYRGPGEGSVRQAIKSHNKRCEPCEYCGSGIRTGLPGNACENCMNTGLKHPEAAIMPPDRESK